MPHQLARIAARLLALILFSVVCLFLPAQVLANPRYVYSDDNDIQTRHPDWMSWLPDSIKLSELSLPGSHDTMSRYDGGYVQTQELYLDRQLLAGIRVLDVRVRHIDDRFAAHHGAYYQRAMFGEVLEKAALFLEAHPTETILMRFGGAGVSPKEGENVTRSFAKTFEWYRDETTYGSKIWQRPDATRADGMPTDQCGSNNNSEGQQQDYIPTLGEVRGKIVILQDFKNGANFDTAPAGPPCYGIWVRGNTKVAIQDKINVVTTIYDIEDKWNDVKSHLTATQNGSPSVLYQNYLTEFSILAAPLTIAGGSAVITGVNDYALEHLLIAGLDRTGILMMDFPGAALIDVIIAHNFRLRDPAKPITALANDFEYLLNNIAYGGTEIGGDRQAEGRRNLLSVFVDQMLPDQGMNYFVAIDDLDVTWIVGSTELYKETDYINTDNIFETREYVSMAFNTKTPNVYTDAELAAVVEGLIASGSLGGSLEGITQKLYNGLVAALPRSTWNVFAKEGDGGFDNWAYGISSPAIFYRREIADKDFVAVGTGYRCPALTQPGSLRFKLLEPGRPLVEWDPVANATHYVVVSSDNPLFHEVRYDTRYLSYSPLAPGTYNVYVRAVASEDCSGRAAQLLVTIPPEPVLFGIDVRSEDTAGLGTGTVTVDKPPVSQNGGNFYTPGQVVTLTATPTSRSEFVMWSGNAATCGSSPTCQLTIPSDTNLAVSAVFRPRPSLVVYSNGNGTVDVTPAGATCSNSEYTCLIYATGSPVALTPTPGEGSVFERWKGDSDCADGSVTMIGNRTCTAVFKNTSHHLTVEPFIRAEVLSDPPGAIDCGTGTDCSESYPVVGGEKTVFLAATLAPGSVFVRWAGSRDCWDEDEDDDDPLRIRLKVGVKDVDCRVIAVAEGTEYALTVEKLGGGTVKAVATPVVESSDIDCLLSACSQNYLVNTQVQLTAAATRGSVFAGWDGDADCADGSVSMVENLTCVATFNSSVLVVNGDNDDTSKEQNQYIPVLRQMEFLDYTIWSVKHPNAGDNSTDPATGNRRVEPVASDLAPFGRVLWYTGRAAASPSSSSPAAGPSAAAEADLATYLDNGGCLMLSSPQYHRDRGLTSFAQNYLGISAMTEDVVETHVRATGDPSLGFSDLASEIGFDPPNPFRFQAASAARISDAMVHDSDVAGSDVLFRYRDGSGDAAVAVDNGIYRTAFLGFPFLGLNSGNDRINVLRAFMDYCGQAPRDDLLEVNDDFDGATEREGVVFLKNLRILPGNDDYFRWVSTGYADTRFAISFAHASGDLALEIYDGSRDLIASSQSQEDQEGVVVANVDAGDVFYLRVFGVDDATTPYRLDIFPAGPSDRDHDGVADLDDALPDDASEQSDADGDGIGDNADPDDDNDGMSDECEVLNQFDPLSAADAFDDKDVDGFTNLEECREGSDPDDPESVPAGPPVALSGSCRSSALDPGNGDFDGDGICDDGDSSGTSGNASCAGGNAAGCDDNCPMLANTDQADTDGDGVGQACDACLNVANANQLDVDGDGFGNLCDADFDQNGIVNFGDLAILRKAFFTSDPVVDLNGDGVVNFADLALMRRGFFKAPGPSSVSP